MVHETAIFHQRRRESGVKSAARAIARTALPVFVLFAIIVGALMRWDTLVTGLDPVFAPVPGASAPSQFLTQTLLLLPLGLFAVVITSRRLGLSYSASAILAAWGLVLGVIGASAGFETEGVPSLDLPPFAAQLFVAAALSQLVCAFVFDAVRGPQWWRAPLFSMLIGGVFFAVAYQVAVVLAGGVFATGELVTLSVLAIMIAAISVFPYQLMRPMVRPLFGLGGY